MGGVKSEEQAVLVTEPVLTSHNQREQKTMIMFEEMNVPAFYLGVQPILSFYSYGRSSGLVFESGEGSCQAFIVWEGYTIKHSISRLNIGGGDVTDSLLDLFHAKGISLSRDVVNDIKEKHCYVSLDPANEIFNRHNNKNGNKIEEKKYLLPDGKEVGLGKEIFNALN